MKIIEINGAEGTVEIEGVRRTTNLALVENVQVGNYVLVHAGFALQILNESEAQETLELFQEMIKKMDDEIS